METKQSQLRRGGNLVIRPLRFLISLGVMTVLAGCAVGPDYKRPTVTVENQWNAQLPHNGNSDALVNWWQKFDDAVLLSLLQSAETNNPTLARAAAAIDESRAALTSSNANFLPSVSLNASNTKSGDKASASTSVTSTRKSTGLDASWELDVFGATRRASESARAGLDASVGSWHDARISLAAEVASTYVNYRACQLQLALNEKDQQSRQETARITGLSVNAGLTSSANGALAAASAASAQSSLISQKAECDLTIKSLVMLTGLAEPELRLQLASGTAKLPSLAEFSVDSIPASLVSQRPDVAVAERNLVAANAAVGVAVGNEYPRFSLQGAISLLTVAGTQTKPWSFGPSLSLPLFEGGAGVAGINSAKARYAQSLASYRNTVASAVKEVEQALVRLDAAIQREKSTAASAQGYRQFFDATSKNWQAGGVSLLTLEDARRTAISADQSLVSLQRDRVLYWIALYKALGGGWQGDLSAPKS
jgi:multidrug efflux system outer membrane protein